MKKKCINLVSAILVLFLISGCAGQVGKDGINGTNGTKGIDGTNGTNGIEGTDGTNGVNGKAGTSGTNGINGKDGINGTNGTKGIDGTDGTNGVNGKAGTSGTNGINGKDGSNGLTPFIGSNGNWWIGITDTNVSASREQEGLLNINYKTYTEIPTQYDVSFPSEIVAYSRKYINPKVTFTSAELSVIYADYNEFINSNSVTGTIYDNWESFSKYNVRAEISGFVDSSFSGENLSVFIGGFGQINILFETTINSDGTFSIDIIRPTYFLPSFKYYISYVALN